MTQLNLTSQEKAQLEQLGLPLSNYGNRGLLAIDGNTITITYDSDYTFQGTAFPETCTATMTK